METRVSEYLFIHLPKTAGTSLWAAIAGLFGREAVSDPVGAAVVRSPADVAALLRYRLVSGHFSHDDLAHFPDLPRLCILRDPIDRCISTYFFLRNHQSHVQMPNVRLARELSLDEYFELGPEALFRDCSNRAVRQLGAHALNPAADLDAAMRNAKDLLSRSFWVGMYETLQEDMARLAAHPDFAGIAELPRIRVTEGRLGVEKVDPATRARIVNLNPYDMELYAWVRSERSAMTHAW